jgi:hypothetical protein
MKLLSKEEIINWAYTPRKNGVYFFIKNNEIVYIGSTVNFLQRFIQHNSLRRIKFDAYYFIETENFREIEKCYIWKFDPIYNKKNSKDIIFYRSHPDDEIQTECWTIKCSVFDKIIKKYIEDNHLPIDYNLELPRLKIFAPEEIEIERVGNYLYYDTNAIDFIITELLSDYDTKEDKEKNNTHNNKIAKILLKYIYGE